MTRIFTRQGVRLLLLSICFICASPRLFAQFSGEGKGTKEEPYRIVNAAQLNEVRNYLGKDNVYFSLEADIDMSEWIAENDPVQGWLPIGSSETSAFKGIFNGNGHTISNLWIDRPDTDNVGLFGYVYTDFPVDPYIDKECRITGIHLVNADIKGRNSVGGIVGEANADSYCKTSYIYISDCSSDGRISGNNEVGGIVGYAHSDAETPSSYYHSYARLSINDCLSNCDISGNKEVGGIVGFVYATTRNHGTSYLYVEDCFSDCRISGNEYVGGITGKAWGSYRTGGFRIDGCYAENELKANVRVGGIVGGTDESNIIKNCYATGTIEGIDMVGGIMGGAVFSSSEESISFCYAHCREIIGKTKVAGIDGALSAECTKSVGINERIIATDSVLSRIANGGNILSDNLAWTSTYMKVNDEVQPTPPDDGPNGTGTDLATLKLQATYEGLGWNFASTWTIQEGESFPYLQKQTAPPHFAPFKVGDTQLSGRCTEDGTIKVCINNKVYTAQVVGGTWNLTVDALKGGEVVKAFVQAEGKMPSYTVSSEVALPGSGTEEDPFLISSISGLQAIASWKGEPAYYKLTTDIDLSEWIAENNDGKGWIPVGGNHLILHGHLDGDGHTISGLSTDPAYDYRGLFAAWAADGSIKNLNLNVEIIASCKWRESEVYTGGLVGKNAGVIESCRVKGAISTSDTISGLLDGPFVGGIAGENKGTIVACRFIGDITTRVYNSAGGIAGENKGTIVACQFIGDITTGSLTCAGGICRSNSGIVAECHTKGSINGFGGGIVYNNYGQVYDCYSYMTISSVEGECAGIATNNYSYSNVTRCYAMGDITGEHAAAICYYNGTREGGVSHCLSIDQQITTKYENGYLVGIGTVDLNNNYYYSTKPMLINGEPKTRYDYHKGDGFSENLTKVRNKRFYVSEGMGWDMTTVWDIDDGAGYPYLPQFYVPISAVSLDKAEAEIHAGTTLQLVSTALPKDASRPAVTWISSDTDIATVDEQGVVTALSVGHTTITATSKENTALSASCEVAVLPKLAASITLDKTEFAVEIEKTAQLTATVQPEDAADRSVTWTSNNAGVASVEADGKITAIALGTAVITATTNDGTNLTASCTVTVTPKKAVSISLDKESLSLIVKEKEQLTALVLPEDAGDRSVTWRSEDKNIATVNDNGVVTAVGVGATRITATTNDDTDLTASCEVTVLPILATTIQINKDEATLEQGKTLTLTATVLPADATDKTVRWHSDNDNVASVDESGTITAKSVGTTTVHATTTDGSDLTASCTVTVLPKKATSVSLNKKTLSLETGVSERLTVNVLPVDAGDRSVTWSSNNTGIASVDAGGKVTALLVGTAVITATTNDGSNLSASCVVTVLPKKATSIVLNKRKLTLGVDEIERLTATVLPDDAEDHSVTWTSSDNSIATVDVNGVVTALSVGTATITATTNDGSNLSASCQVTIEAPNSIDELGADGITCYPNPTSDRLFVTGTTAETVIRMFDQNGRWLRTVSGEAGRTEIDVRTLPAGIYVLSITTDGNTVQRRFVKE